MKMIVIAKLVSSEFVVGVLTETGSVITAFMIKLKQIEGAPAGDMRPVIMSYLAPFAPATQSVEEFTRDKVMSTIPAPKELVDAYIKHTAIGTNIIVNTPQIIIPTASPSAGKERW
jgi:hypothetical protein